MRLSENDCKALACAYFRGDEPISKIAQECDLPQHVVRRSLEGLIACGFITRRVYLNPFRLGYQDYLLLMSTEPDKVAETKLLLEQFRRAPEVAWMGAVGPNLQYECNVLARSAAVLQRFLARVMSRTGGLRLSKELLLTQSHTWFVPKFLSTDQRTHQVRSCSVFDTPVSTDDLDHQILIALTKANFTSLSQMARDLRVAPSTVAYRFERLKGLGVVVACGFRIAASHLIGAVPARFRLTLTKPLEESRTRIRDLCRVTPGVYYLSEHIGRFDVTIGCRVPHTRDIRTMVDSFRASLGTLVGHIEPITDDAAIKPHTYAYSSEDLESPLVVENDDCVRTVTPLRRAGRLHRLG